MSRARLIILISMTMAVAPRLGAQAAPDLGTLGWLAGCWELARGPRSTLEMWMPPAGGLMLGASRTVVSGQVREFERLQLSVRDGRVVYTALPSGQAETDFTATAMSDSGFTVENPAHDFPTRIRYARRGADSLVAAIEGPGPAGPRVIEFPLRRVACEGR